MKHLVRVAPPTFVACSTPEVAPTGTSPAFIRTWLLLSSLSGVLLAANPVLNYQKPVVVRQAEQLRFTADRPVVWSLSPGSQGTIDATGVYTAPTRISVRQTAKGCQLLPNDHIINTRVDTLPVHPSSTAWTALIKDRVRYTQSFPTNVLYDTTPWTTMIFAYTPQYNGQFQVFSPERGDRIETGWYVPPFSADRHLIGINPKGCMIQEQYNLYPPGTNTAQFNNCPNCTSQSGLRYHSLASDLPDNATDAAGAYLLPLTLRVDEIERALLTRGSINHAIRATLPNSVLGSRFVWPATANASAWGVVPYGTRFRLRPSYTSASTNPVTQLLLRQLKEYGLIVTDGGLPWEISVDDDRQPRPLIDAAFQELFLASDLTSYFEVVDVSSLDPQDGSGLLRIDPTRRETNDATFGGFGALVTATDPLTGSASRVRVILQGQTIGAAVPRIIFQAGAAPRKLDAFLNGGAAAIGWSIPTGAPGVMTQDGYYTPPGSLSEPVVFDAMVRSIDDPAVFDITTIVVLPTGVLRLAVGRQDNIRDSQGNVWWGTSATDPLQLMDSGRDYDNGGDWPNTPDIGLYRRIHYGRDQGLRIHIPNGRYIVTFKLANGEAPPGVAKQHIEVQGKLFAFNLDVAAAAGGQRRPLDIEAPAEVVDGSLSLIMRWIGDVGWHSVVSSILIREASLPVQGSLSISLSKNSVESFQSVQATAVGGAVAWSMSPSLGLLTASGLYTAPLVSEATSITIIGTSVADSRVTARATLLIKPPSTTTVRVNAGGPQFVDSQGRIWSSDSGYNGTSTTYSGGAPISNVTTDLQPLFQSSRYSYANQSFAYRFPMANGSYTVTLLFAEYRRSEEYTPYNFDVEINNTRVLSSFDPVVAVGGVGRAYLRSFTVVVSDNIITINFRGLAAPYLGAMINGIEIVPTTQLSMALQRKKRDRDKIGLYRPGTTGWALDKSGDFKWGAGDVAFALGAVGDIPIVGDWDGSGRYRVGLFRDGVWYFDMNGDNRWTFADDKYAYFGTTGDIPVVGDWTGEGRSMIGVYRRGLWVLDWDNSKSWTSCCDRVYLWGTASDVPVVGDWTGSGIWRAGLFNSGQWKLDLNGDFAYTAGVDAEAMLGAKGDKPIPADLFGDGRHMTTVFRSTGAWVTVYGTVGTFGGGDDVPIVGPWQ